MFAISSCHVSHKEKNPICRHTLKLAFKQLICFYSLFQGIQRTITFFSNFLKFFYSRDTFGKIFLDVSRESCWNGCDVVFVFFSGINSLTILLDA